MVTSLPHFLHGDPILSEDFEGLNPEKDKHEAFVELDPVSSITRKKLTYLKFESFPLC